MGKKNAPIDRQRRIFMASLAAAAGGSLAACNGANRGNGSNPNAPGISPKPSGEIPLPAPQDSGIDHVVVLMMENRSYDHMLGWVPNSDGVQAGLSFPDANGKLRESFDLGQLEDFQGCGLGDPNHGYNGGRVHMNEGKMDGWLLTGPTINNPEDDTFPIGYYGRDHLPFFSGCADNWTVCDRYFTGVLAQTYPNRVYMHAGQTDRLENTLPYAEADASALPNIFDHLAGAGVEGRYYFHDLPLAGLWGVRALEYSSPIEEFRVRAASGTLPAVSYVDPVFLGEAPYGVSADDHPQADVRDGQGFMADIYNTLRSSPNWERTLLVINYDEWGGFYDHVVPPVAPVSEAEAALGNDGRLGFRVPCILIGPRAKRGHVCSKTLDPNSILNFITWRFGLEPIGGPRADWSLNLAHALDFENEPQLEAPDIPGPAGFGPFRVVNPLRYCSEGGIPDEVGVPFKRSNPPSAHISHEDHNRELKNLQNYCRQIGFKIPG
ncbi:MAG: alkaline phosphatase family protein [Oceanococcus sp.]